MQCLAEMPLKFNHFEKHPPFGGLLRDFPRVGGPVTSGGSLAAMIYDMNLISRKLSNGMYQSSLAEGDIRVKET